MKNDIALSRRGFMLKGLQLAATGVAATLPVSLTYAAEGKEVFEIQRSVAEWKKLLTDKQYDVLREEATERPFTSPLLAEKRAGLFHCAGCDLPVYSSTTKYKSGTGWPSFYESLANAIRTKEDRTFFSVRTEVHCRRCGGHFGHVFDDGPEPTGKRHCLNGVALTFKPGKTA